MNWSGVEDEFRSAVMFMFTQLFRMWENFHYQARQGTLESVLWEAPETGLATTQQLVDAGRLSAVAGNPT